MGNRKVFEDSMQVGASAAWDSKWDQAIAAYQRALEEFPHDVGALTGLGLAYSGAGQMEAALESYQRASELAPDDPALYEHIGKTWEQLGQGKHAADAYLASAERYLNQQEAPHLALERWQDAVRADSDCLQAHAELLQYYYRHGLVREAVQECLALARIYRARRQREHAMQVCEYALKLAPHDPEVLAILDDLRYGEQTAVELEAGVPQDEPGPPTAIQESIDSTVLDFDVTLPVEPSHGRGSLIEITRHKALADLAESVFEEEEEAAASGTTSRFGKAERDALIGQAIDAQVGGRVEEAISAYERVIRAGVERPAIHFNLGLLYQEKTRFDAAVSQFERAKADLEYALGSHFALGECYRARGRTDEALKHFVEALKMVDLATFQPERAGELVQLYDNLADSHIAEGERDRTSEFIHSVVGFLSQEGWQDTVVQARRQLDTLAPEGPVLSLAEMLAVTDWKHILQSLALAQGYTERGMFYAALEECYHALRFAPTCLPIHRQVAQVLVAMGQVEEAVSKFVVIADTYWMRGAVRPAVAMYEHALQLAPMDMAVRTELIDLLIAYGEIDQALEHSLTLADSYYHLAQIDQACEAYQEALQLAPRSHSEREWKVRILHKIGDIHMQRVDWRRAVEVYEQIRRLAPEDERARSTLVDLYYRCSRPELAAVELDSLLRIHRESGRIQRIIPFLEDIVRERPDDIPLRTRLAQVYLDTGDAEQALKHLDTLGDLLLEAGRHEEAMATIRAIIALQPSNIADYQQLLDQLSARGFS